MVIFPNIMEYISTGNDKAQLQNINIGECAKEYIRFIGRARTVYGSLGVVCQNTIEASLVGGAVDCMIFPASVLESQIHREIASEFEGKVLLEINRDVNTKIVLDFMKSVSARHCFIGVDQHGLLCRKSSKGNTDVAVLIEKNEASYLDLYEYKSVYLKKLNSQIYDVENKSVSLNSAIKYFVEKFEGLQ